MTETIPCEKQPGSVTENQSEKEKVTRCGDAAHPKHGTLKSEVKSP